MTQPSLFDNPFSQPSDICRNYHGGNEQSEAANVAIQPRKQSMRMRILEWWTQESTVEECELALGMKHQTVSARVSELRKDGLLQDTGRTRPTSSGSQAEILRARVEW
jgi:predicted transcriptional regulator